MANRAIHETCTLFYCDDPHYARGLCATHYQRWQRYGGVLPVGKRDIVGLLHHLIISRHIIEMMLEMDRDRKEKDGEYEALLSDDQIENVMEWLRATKSARSIYEDGVPALSEEEEEKG